MPVTIECGECGKKLENEKVPRSCSSCKAT